MWTSIDNRFALLVAVALSLLTTRADAQVRFYVDGGKQTTTVKNGASTTLHAKVTIAKAKRTTTFKTMDIFLGFEGTLGVKELRVEDAQPQFLKRFQGDDLTVVIVPAVGETGTILSNTREALTFKYLVNSAELESRSQNKITLKVRGWNITGYTTKKLWDAGEGTWVKKQEPIWSSTTLAEGVFEITGIENAKSADTLFSEAVGLYSSGEDEKAFTTARLAIKLGKVEAHATAAQAACRLKNRAAALEHFANVADKYARSSIKALCTRMGIELEAQPGSK